MLWTCAKTQNLVTVLKEIIAWLRKLGGCTDDSLNTHQKGNSVQNKT